MRATLIAAALLAGSVAAQEHGKPGFERVRRHALERRQATDTAATGAAAAPATTAAVDTAASAPAAGAATTPAAADTAATAAATSATSAGGIIPSIINSLTATSSAAVTSDTALATSATVETSAAVTTSRAVRTSATSAPSVAVVTSTSTSVPASSVTGLPTLSSSNTAAQSSATDSANKSSGGIGHATLISIIVIASCVAGIAAIWTIIRKVKFSPSRRFEAKLAPIEFSPDGKEKDRTSFDDPFPRAASIRGGRDSPYGSSVNQAGFGSGYAQAGYSSGSLHRQDSDRSYTRGAPQSDVGAVPGSLGYNQPAYDTSALYGVPAYTAPSSRNHEYGYPDLQRGQSARDAYGRPAYGAGGRY